MHHVQPLTGGFWKNWKGFVGVVLALSGVEAIANSTGVMKLNPGTTEGNPNVSKTSTQTHRPLYLLFVRSSPALTEQDYKRKWQDDEEAREVFIAAKSKAGTHPVFACYAVSDSVATTIVDITATTGASYLILGAPDRVIFAREHCRRDFGQSPQ